MLNEGPLHSTQVRITPLVQNAVHIVTVLRNLIKGYLPKEHPRSNELNHVFVHALLIFVFFSLDLMPVKVNLLWLTVLLSNASEQHA